MAPRRRRTLRLLVIGIAGVVFLASLPASAAPRGRPVWEAIEPARELLDGATPRAGAVRLELPAVTQDGSSVPLTVSIESPMTPDDYIEALYLYASENPSPEVAEFRFTPLAGRAVIDTRIRLNQSQAVVALARTSRGEWLAGSREVRVTVSGCISQGSGEDDGHMRPLVRTPARLRAGQPGEVRTLIRHPMETGLREDGRGELVPQRIIEEFRAELEGETVITARFHRAIAANPYLRFYVAPGRTGTLGLKWVEDTGQAASAGASIPDL